MAKWKTDMKGVRPLKVNTALYRVLLEVVQSGQDKTKQESKTI